ncbi:DUF3466 family protein [Vibrio coralliilyticus]|uniref:DUF3466 family protein n=1 Tax=Vibrio coralliilyticus TaxID=190893 RepID=UPI00148CAEEC|nr:DUF3466 family protein [Vibrio coralliilyticus]NOI31578.1 DUF3466 family protein [Vibrio coralliilyticus]NOI50998.1 DUF3466 family protein [Vibrio coralliilyticus]
MSSKIFKLSSITLAVAASFGAHAAIYNVYKYEPVVASSSESFGAAIQPSTVDCWTSISGGGTDCSITHTTSQMIAFEEKRFAEGFQYRDEAPFFHEFGFDLLEEGYDGFKSYCSSFLGYNDTLCDHWATTEYTNGFRNEDPNGDLGNSTAFVESTKVTVSSNNLIINSLDSTGAEIVGTYQESAAARTRAFIGTTSSATIIFNDRSRSRAWAKEGTLAVGSVSTQSGNDPDDYYSHAAVWDGANFHQIPWLSNVGEDGRSMPQASARDLATIGGTTYAVGYASNEEEVPVAAVFNLTNLNSIPTSFISLYENNHGDYNDRYLNSVLNSVNDKGTAVGTVKYRVVNNGAYSNTLIYVSDVSNSALSTTTFTDKFGGIFFEGANGKAGAINNNDEVVGAVDNQTHQESGGGKPRSQRAFIAPLDTTNAKAPLNSKAWYLDDLTNDGSSSSDNNQYRIIDATDINDAGVISGTALYCAGGYDTTAIDSKCDGGTPGAEKRIAVKLVPINGATTSDIQARSVTQEDKVDRQGGSLGFLALTLLGFLGFRRK